MRAYYGYMVPHNLVYDLGKHTTPPITKEVYEGGTMPDETEIDCWTQILGDVLEKCEETGLKARHVVVIDPKDPSRDWGMIATAFAAPEDDRSEPDVPHHPYQPTEEELGPLKELFGSDAELVFGKMRDC